MTNKQIHPEAQRLIDMLAGLRDSKGSVLDDVISEFEASSTYDPSTDAVTSKSAGAKDHTDVLEKAAKLIMKMQLKLGIPLYTKDKLND